MRSLIEAGASVNHINKSEQTPLSLALLSFLKHPEHYRWRHRKHLMSDVISLLLEKGADPNLHKTGTDSSLFLAAQTKEYTIVNKLLQYKADLYHIGKDQKTVLQKLFTSCGMSYVCRTIPLYCIGRIV